MSSTVTNVTMGAATVESVASIVSQVTPIPSIVPKTAELSEQSTRVEAISPVKYKITVMPEATCDGCQ